MPPFGPVRPFNWRVAHLTAPMCRRRQAALPQGELHVSHLSIVRPQFRPSQYHHLLDVHHPPGVARNASSAAAAADCKERQSAGMAQLFSIRPFCKRRKKLQICFGATKTNFACDGRNECNRRKMTAADLRRTRYTAVLMKRSRVCVCADCRRPKSQELSHPK